MNRDILDATIDDLVTNLLYYDRKSDEELPVGAIEKAIADGLISTDEIAAIFKRHLEDYIK